MAKAQLSYQKIGGHRYTHYVALFLHKMNIRHPGQLKKNKILGAVLELPAEQHC